MLLDIKNCLWITSFVFCVISEYPFYKKLPIETNLKLHQKAMDFCLALEYILSNKMTFRWSGKVRSVRTNPANLPGPVQMVQYQRKPGLFDHYSYYNYIIYNSATKLYLVYCIEIVCLSTVRPSKYTHTRQLEFIL